MSDSVLKIENLNKSFGGIHVTKNVDLELTHGKIHALIGPNGSGKTTLLRQIAAEIQPDSGDIIFKSESIRGLKDYEIVKKGIVRSFQITSIFFDLTVLQNLIIASKAHLGHSYYFFKSAFEDEQCLEIARHWLKQFKMESVQHTKASLLSYGEKRQLELMMVLTLKPQILLLDEPLAGMGSQESNHFIEILRDIKNDYAILLIEHDMAAVFSLADVITVLDEGKVVLTDAPSVVRHNDKVKQIYLGDDSA